MSHLEESLAFQLRAAGLPEPERQYRFHPVRKWRVDFCYPQAAPPVAIEVEGALWKPGGGRHNRGSSVHAEMDKYNELSLMGFRLLRFSEKHIKSGAALAAIERALRA